MPLLYVVSDGRNMAESCEKSQTAGKVTKLKHYEAKKYISAYTNIFFERQLKFATI